MKFKKLISSALLFLAAIVGISPAHADYAVTFTPVSNKVVVQTTTVPNTYAATFNVVSSFSNIKQFTLSPSVTIAPANLPAQISALKLTPVTLTFNTPAKK